jgi:hypothetical protein
MPSHPSGLREFVNVVMLAYRLGQLSRLRVRNLRIMRFDLAPADAIAPCATRAVAVVCVCACALPVLLLTSP